LNEWQPNGAPDGAEQSEHRRGDKVDEAHSTQQINCFQVKKLTQATISGYHLVQYLLIHAFMGHDKHATGSETIIAQGVKVEGEFRSNGNVVIDGELNGSIATEQSLYIGETAVIRANVAAKNAVVAGVIVGNVMAPEGLELLATSRVDGDIQTGKISIAAGARVNGSISMGE